MGILKGLTIALAGDIKDYSDPPKTISYEQLKKWICNNDGKWTPSVRPQTTHLICSKEAYKKRDGAGTYIHIYDSLTTPFFSSSTNTHLSLNPYDNPIYIF